MRNIRIRAVTVGMSFTDLNTQNSSKFLADFYQKTDAEFKKNQIAIQTQRLTCRSSRNKMAVSSSKRR